MIDNNESQNKYHTQFCSESCVFSLNIKFNVGFQPFCSIFLPQIKEEFNYIEIKIFNKRKDASKFKGVHSSIVNIVVNFCELKIWLWINYCPVSLLSIHDSNFINQKILRTTHPLNVFFPSVSYILSAPWFWIKKSGICTVVPDRRVTTLGTHDVIASTHCRSVGLKSSKKLPHRGSWTICYIVLLRASNRWLKKKLF